MVQFPYKCKIGRPVRRLAVAVISLVGPSAALGLSLGDIQCDTALNEPLRARIHLEMAASETIEDLKVRLGSAEAFKHIGIVRSSNLMRLRFEPATLPSGEHVILVTTEQPVKEPILDFLVDVRLPEIPNGGGTLREYTILLDPPVLVRKPAPMSKGTDRATRSTMGLVPASAVTISRESKNQSTGKIIAPAVTPSSSVRELAEALRLYWDQQYAAALEHFLAVRKLGADTPEVTLNLGATYYHLGRLAEARSEFEKLLGLPSFAPLARYNLGLIDKSAGNMDIGSAQPKVQTPERPTKAEATIQKTHHQDDSASHTGMGWFVQVGSFRQNSNAQALREKLTAKVGAPVFVEPAETGGMYRVKIGPLPDRMHAEEVRTRLMTQDNIVGFLVRRPAGQTPVH